MSFFSRRKGAGRESELGRTQGKPNGAEVSPDSVGLPEQSARASADPLAAAPTPVSASRAAPADAEDGAPVGSEVGSTSAAPDARDPAPASTAEDARDGRDASANCAAPSTSPTSPTSPTSSAASAPDPLAQSGADEEGKGREAAGALRGAEASSGESDPENPQMRRRRKEAERERRRADKARRAAEAQIARETRRFARRARARLGARRALDALRAAPRRLRGWAAAVWAWARLRRRELLRALRILGAACAVLFALFLFVGLFLLDPSVDAPVANAKTVQKRIRPALKLPDPREAAQRAEIAHSALACADEDRDLRRALLASGADALEADGFVSWLKAYAQASPSDAPREGTLKKDSLVHVEVNAMGELFAVDFVAAEDGEDNLFSFAKRDGAWRPDEGKRDTESVFMARKATVTSSFAGALAKNDAPLDIRESLRQIFKREVKLNDLKPGDQVALIYEAYTRNGEPVGTGPIVAARVDFVDKDGSPRTLKSYHYSKGREENFSYYDEQGITWIDGFEVKPLERLRVTSPFGMRLHPIRRSWRMHTGIDYAAPRGAPIRAVRDGTVAYAGRRGGYGIMVALDHDEGVTTYSAHMSAIAPLKIGQKVKAGDVIGLVGATGFATGPHLHFEVRINGIPVDPALNLAGSPYLGVEDADDFSKTVVAFEGALETLIHSPNDYAGGE